MNRNIVRFMGVVSLLLVFEFLVLLLHPIIENFTHHNKVLELLILVVIGAGLVPLHHRLEHLVIAKLTNPLFPKPEILSEEDRVENAALTESEVTVATPSIEDDLTVQKKSASSADTEEAAEE